MIKNVGNIDRTLRLLLGLFLVWLGLFVFEGKKGNLLGVIVSITALMPFYMVATRSCFVFRWFKIHSLSKKECGLYGVPYQGERETTPNNP